MIPATSWPSALAIPVSDPGYNLSDSTSPCHGHCSEFATSFARTAFSLSNPTSLSVTLAGSQNVVEEFVLPNVTRKLDLSRYSLARPLLPRLHECWQRFR